MCINALLYYLKGVETSFMGYGSTKYLAYKSPWPGIILLVILVLLYRSIYDAYLRHWGGSELFLRRKYVTLGQDVLKEEHWVNLGDMYIYIYIWINARIIGSWCIPESPFTNQPQFKAINITVDWNTATGSHKTQGGSVANHLRPLLLTWFNFNPNMDK